MLKPCFFFLKLLCSDVCRVLDFSRLCCEKRRPHTSYMAAVGQSTYSWRCVLVTCTYVCVCVDCVIVTPSRWKRSREWGLCLVPSAICADTCTKAHGKCSPVPPPPFLCVWSLQSVNMSLLIAIRARISQMHFPFPPYIRRSLRFISLTVTAAFQSHCPDSFWSFCPFIFGIIQACSL